MAPLGLAVDTQHGPVHGFTDTHPLQLTSPALAQPPLQPGNRTPVLKWLAIPYAHADRFKRPVAPTSWSDPKPCLEFGSVHLPPPPPHFGLADPLARCSTQFPQPPSNTELLCVLLQLTLERRQH